MAFSTPYNIALTYPFQDTFTCMLYVLFKTVISRKPHWVDDSSLKTFNFTCVSFEKLLKILKRHSINQNNQPIIDPTPTIIETNRNTIIARQPTLIN